jgi:SNF2 family DNA or RNA helicase
VRGQWVELQREEIERAIAFFKKKHRQGEMDLGEALRIGLGQETSETGLPVTDVEGEGWVGDLLKQMSDQARIPMVEPPAEFHGQLRPYQARGVSWLAFLQQYGLGACLADDMGLGKTIELIALLLAQRQDQAGSEPTLLVCPMSIVGNWQRELQRFGPSLRVMVHHGAERLSGQAFEDEVGRHDVVLTTYSLAHRDETHLSRIEWACIVLDEAQNIKNQSAKQTQALRRLSARRRIALTGTPVENRLSELWSIMDFLNQGYLGSAKDFHTRFANPIERYRDADKSQALKRLIQPFVLRRLKTDKSIIADLPEKLEMKVLCNLTSEQATLYQAVVKDMLARIEESEGIERRGLVLATLMKLKQVCNHPAHFLGDGSELPGRSGKLARLEEMLEEALACGDKALIFTQFSELGDRLRGHLQRRFGREALFLHGGTTKKQRDAMVQRFQADRSGPPLFILSIKAGGVGLNLTGANRVFHFDRWWNPAVENQATDRAFRIGQTRSVLVHKFLCRGTVEEKIDALIESKKTLTRDLLEGGAELNLTEMRDEELLRLVSLDLNAAIKEG